MFQLPIILIATWLHIDPYAQSGFQTYGDIMQFLILFALIVLLILKDYIGILQLFLSSCIALGIMLLSKQLFIYLAKNSIDDTYLSISKRPATNDFSGFPSGHTTAAFVVAGFVCKRYGFRYGIFMLIVALFVGISRIYAEKHTSIQVICGGILGFCGAYFLSKKIA